MKKAKQRAARRRDLARQEKLRKIMETEENFRRIKAEGSGLRRPGDEHVKLKLRKGPPKTLRRDFPDIPSHGPGEFVPVNKPIYIGEMAKREAEAQKEANRKKNQVAPVYNKGAPQYISEGMMDEFVSGKLRRRS